MLKTKLPAFVLAVSASLTAATISVVPPATNITPGTVFTVGVNVADVADLYAFQFSLNFNPALLSTVVVSQGDFPGASFFPGTLDDVNGAILFISDSLTGPGPGVSGSATLATVQFRANGAGTSPIMLSDVVLLSSSLADIPVAAANGSVNVVPEPASVWLGAAGGLALLVLRRCGRDRPVRHRAEAARPK